MTFIIGKNGPMNMLNKIYIHIKYHNISKKNYYISKEKEKQLNIHSYLPSFISYVYINFIYGTGEEVNFASFSSSDNPYII